MEYKEAMANLTSINVTLYQSLTQAHAIMLVLSKQLQSLQTQEKSKTQTTERPVLYKKKKDTILNFYCWNHGNTRSFEHTSATFRFPKILHQVGATLGNKMRGSEKCCKYDNAHE